MNTNPYRAWTDSDQHVAAILRAMNAPPATYASAMHNAVINRARSAPITVTHIASADDWRKAINEARDKANAQQIWQEPTHA